MCMVLPVKMPTVSATEKTANSAVAAAIYGRCFTRLNAVASQVYST